jgi:hypothetical protein
LQSGLKAFVDWDAEACGRPTSWNDLETLGITRCRRGCRPRRLGCHGMLLDMHACAASTSTSRQRERETVDNSTELSIEGGGLCLSKRFTLERHLSRQLKYVCLRYAVWPLHQGLLQGLSGPDRSHSIAYYGNVGWISAWTWRLSDQCDGTSRLQKRGNSVERWWPDASSCCSLSWPAACSFSY